MSEELDKELEDCMGIVMAIHELRDELPEIQASKDQIDKQVKDFNTLIKNKKGDIEKVADKKKDEILEIENNISSIQEKIDGSLAQYENIETYVSDIDNIKSRVENLEKEQEKINSEITKLQKNKSNGSTVNAISNNFIDKLKYYNPLPMRYLYQIFEPQTPFIVKSTIWSGDFCFVVTKVEDDVFYGKYYLHGKPNPQRADWKFLDIGGKDKKPEYLFTFYNGKDSSKILESINKD